MTEKENQTEAATPTRLTKASSEGDVPISRETTTFVVMAGSLLTIGVLLTGPFLQLKRSLVFVFAHCYSVDSKSTLLFLIAPVGRDCLIIVFLFGISCAVCAIIGTFGQSGLKLKKTALGLQFNRINPLSGFANMISSKHTVSAAQSVVKIGAISAIIYALITHNLFTPLLAMPMPVASLNAMVFRSLMVVMLGGVAVQGIIAAADFAWSRRQFAARNQMSQTEIKDEQRELDGDPAVKSRIKMLRAQQAKRNLKAAMSRATVVITNPTHYAIALEYQSGQTSAPRIVAKGADYMAATIRELAAEFRLPLVSNPPLARALYGLDEDSEITPEHYQAVAEVIAYVWKLAERKSDTGL